MKWSFSVISEWFDNVSWMTGERHPACIRHKQDACCWETQTNPQQLMKTELGLSNYQHFTAITQDNLCYQLTLHPQLRTGGFCWSKFYCPNCLVDGKLGLLNGNQK